MTAVDLRAAAWDEYVARRRHEQGWRADFDDIMARAYPTWLAGWNAGTANNDVRAVLEEIASHPLPGDRLLHGDVIYEDLVRRFIEMAQAALEEKP